MSHLKTLTYFVHKVIFDTIFVTDRCDTNPTSPHTIFVFKSSKNAHIYYSMYCVYFLFIYINI